MNEWISVHDNLPKLDNEHDGLIFSVPVLAIVTMSGKADYRIGRFETYSEETCAENEIEEGFMGVVDFKPHNFGSYWDIDSDIEELFCVKIKDLRGRSDYKGLVIYWSPLPEMPEIPEIYK